MLVYFFKPFLGVDFLDNNCPAQARGRLIRGSAYTRVHIRMSICRRPSLFAVLVFAVLTIRGLKTANNEGKQMILFYFRLKIEVLVF